jgi:hypothetical protein
MSKKTTTPRAASNRMELRRKLARDLASILANPETPTVLYNDIADSITDMSSEIDYNSAEMIERSVNAYFAKEEKRQDEFFEGISDDEGGKR